MKAKILPSLIEQARLHLHFGRRELLVTIVTLGVSAAAASTLANLYDEVAGALIFVLGITIAGALGGLIPALLTSVGAFLVFNFYMAQPVLTFRLATGRDLAPLVIFNLCGLVAGALAGQLRDRAEAARRSNRQLTLLLELSRTLQSAVRLHDVAATAEQAFRNLNGARVELYRIVGTELQSLPGQSERSAWRAFAGEAHASGAGAVRGNTLVALRLDGSDGALGILVLEDARPLSVDTQFLHALSNLVAITLERALLSEQASERRALDRAEELKTALLSSVSHDFRTPLTAISASASSLIAYRDSLDTDTSDKLLQQIVDDCARLNRYTANLLEMSRLETGEGAPIQILGVAEMIGAAIQRSRVRAGNRVFVRHDCAQDLLVRANPALFELVLVNVFDNAVIYSPDGSRIEIVTCRDGDWCRIEIADAGLGIPEADLEKIFERFHRVARNEASPRGSGLGLAIARGFVQALGGTIEARVPGIGPAGTRIVIRLPLAQQPEPA